MKDQRKTEVRVGFTVIVAIIIILWVFGWAKNITVNAERKEYKIEFSSVAGLEIGDPVSVTGMRKGYVDDIIIEGNKAIVTVNLSEEIVLKDDANFYIMMFDLMGGKKVEINPGQSANLLSESIVHKGEFLGDIASAMAVFGSVQKDLIDVIKEVKISLNGMNKILTDNQFNAELKTSLSNLTLLTENLNKLITQNKDEINKLLVSGNELTNSINSFIQNNKDSLSVTLTSLRQTLEQSRKMIINVNELLDKTEKSQNNLGTLLNDPQIMNDIKESLKQLKDLSKLLLEQLQKEGIKVDANIDLF